MRHFQDPWGFENLIVHFLPKDYEKAPAKYRLPFSGTPKGSGNEKVNCILRDNY